MKYIKTFERNSDIELSLNTILDKISTNGLDSLEDKERDFLNSFKKNNQHDGLRKLNVKNYSGGYFDFNLFEVKYKGNILELHGELSLPRWNGIDYNKVSGYFEYKEDGTFECFFDLEEGSYSPWDFVEGLEYEFDSFIDDIIDDNIL